jgi:hypothetical protein
MIEPLVIVGIMTRAASTHNQRGRLTGCDLVLVTIIGLHIQIDDDHVVLLCRTSLAVVRCRRLELDSLKCDDVLIRADGAQIQIATSSDRLWQRSNLRSLITLWGMLDQLDFLLGVGNARSDSQQECVDCMELAVDLNQAGRL